MTRGGYSPKIDIITKMFRNLPFRTSNQTAPGKTACVYRIERVPHADSFRVIYGIEVPRVVEVSGVGLAADFGKTMHGLSNHIYAEMRHYQGITAHQALGELDEEVEIEIEVSL
jgi:hypothetical protein